MERERRKKNPSKFGFHGWKRCGFPKTLKFSFLGGWKNVVINPQIRDEMMECGIYIHIYRKKKTHPNFDFHGWKCCGFPNTNSN
jgi:hypothetical protein